MQRVPFRTTLVIGVLGFGSFAAQSIFDTFVPPLLRESALGLSAVLIGLIATSHYWLSIVIQPTISTLSDLTRTPIGRRFPWIVIFMPLAAVGFTLIAVPTARDSLGVAGIHLPAIVLAIVLFTLAVAFFQGPALALLGDLVPGAQRSRVNGGVQLINGVGLVVAIVLSAAAPQVGDRLAGPAGAHYGPFIVGSGILLVILLASFFLLREPQQPPNTSTHREQSVLANVRAALAHRSIWPVLLGLTCAFMAISAMQIWLSSFAQSALGLAPQQTQILRTPGAIMFLIAPLPAGILATHFGRRPALVVTMGAMALLYAAGFAVTGPALLVLQQFLLAAGVMMFFVNGLPLVLEFDRSAGAAMGAITGLYTLVFNLAYTLGPLAAGKLIDLTRPAYGGKGYYVIFAFCACAMFIGGLVLLIATRRSAQGAVPEPAAARANR